MRSYLALQRMEGGGLIEEADVPAESGDARRRYYQLTREGRESAEMEIGSPRASRCLSAGQEMARGEGDMTRRIIATLRGEDPIGQKIAYDPAPTPESTWYEIIGIVGDHHQQSPAIPPPAEVLENRNQDWGRAEGSLGAP